MLECDALPCLPVSPCLCLPASIDFQMGCKHFPSCSANLCPLDHDLDERAWFMGEAVCKRKDLAALPMIKRQRQLNRKRPGEYTGKPLRAAWLRGSAPRKRVLSEEHRAQLRDRMNKLRKITDPEESNPSPPP